MSFPRAAFASKNVKDNLRIIDANEDIISIIKWCFEE
jgi:hypothetical protein